MTLKKNYTYAEAVKPKNKLVPRLAVKITKKEESLKDATRDVMHYLIKDKTIQTKNIKSYKENELVFDCVNEESVAKALKVLC